MSGRNPGLTRAVLGVSLALLLGACENIRGQLGLNKNSPDEFSVLTSAPLTIPPEFNLRPPEPGAERPQEISVQERVKAALFNASPDKAAASGEPATTGESAILARAGSTGQQSDIRSIINRDNAIFAEDSGNFVNKLIFWRDPLAPGTIVNAAEEDQRLQEAEATGNAPSAGETAIIERTEPGLFEGLF